jgi:hypothetical protein
LYGNNITLSLEITVYEIQLAMSTYRVSLIGGGSGFKVHVADDAGGLRVVGFF